MPVVEELDEFWHRKYGKDENGKVIRVASAEEVCQDGSATDVHLPSPSYWPLVLALGFPFIGYGLIYNLWFCVPGGIMILMSIYAWAFEPPDDPEEGHGEEQHENTLDGETEEVSVD